MAEIIGYHIFPTTTGEISRDLIIEIQLIEAKPTNACFANASVITIKEALLGHKRELDAAYERAAAAERDAAVASARAAATESSFPSSHRHFRIAKASYDGNDDVSFTPLPPLSYHLLCFFCVPFHHTSCSRVRDTAGDGVHHLASTAV